MVNSYSLTKQEQLVLKEIEQENPDIISQQILKHIIKSKESRIKVLYNLTKKGKIIRLKKNNYVLAGSDLMKTATKLNCGYLCLDSALRVHNLIDYEIFTIFVATNKIRKKYSVGQYELKYIPVKKDFYGFKEQNGYLTSTLEKTIYDCFVNSKYISYPIILKALMQLNNKNFNWDYFLDLCKNLAMTEKQRIGYILDLVSESNPIPNKVICFFEKLKKADTKLITTSKFKGKYNSKWKVIDNAELYRYYK